jgi:hypothetical protein
MSLLENQTFQRTLKFIHNQDEEKKIVFTVKVNTNHDIDRSVIDDLEVVINKTFLQNYERFEDFQAKKEAEKQQQKLEKEKQKLENEISKLNKAREKDQIKFQKEQQKQIEKQVKQQVKHHESKPKAEPMQVPKQKKMRELI